MLKLKVSKDKVITTEIIDAEIDLFECEYTNGGTVQIKTNGYTHIDLDAKTLRDLADSIERAEKKYAVILKD